MYGQKTTFAARRESCSETSAEEYRAHYMRLQLSFLLNARILFFFSGTDELLVVCDAAVVGGAVLAVFVEVRTWRLCVGICPISMS